MDISNDLFKRLKSSVTKASIKITRSGLISFVTLLINLEVAIPVVPNTPGSKADIFFLGMIFNSLKEKLMFICSNIFEPIESAVLDRLPKPMIRVWKLLGKLASFIKRLILLLRFLLF